MPATAEMKATEETPTTPGTPATGEISETKGTQATTMMLAAGKQATLGHTRLRVSDGPNSDEKRPSTLSKTKNITRYPSQSHGLIPLRRQ